MNNQILLGALLVFSSIFVVQAQKKNQDPVLFTVAGTPVHVSEFEYIYSKTNGEKADFSRESLDEYLDLYIKFKLKVQKAKDMQLDTIAQLQQELSGYRRQLADSYLIDKQVTDKLVREVYDRSKEDVNISHILVTVGSNAVAEDTLQAYQKITAIEKRIRNGEDFAEVAKQESEDGSTAKNGGYIGYLKPVFPNGFYDIETAAYRLNAGEVSEPIRSKFGYHLIKVNEKRPARGEIEAAHVLIRTQERASEEAKAKIDSLYDALENGAAFENVARFHSEDKRTARNGGNLGLFGINKYEKVFEDAAFSLKEDEEYSRPFESSVGWHIIKRISLRTLQPYNVEKRRLETMVKRDARFEEARSAMVEKIKRESALKEDEAALDNFINSLDETFFARNWRPDESKPQGTLFSFNDEYEVNTGAFARFLYTNTRRRSSMASQGVETAVRTFYDDFLAAEALKYEETKLEEKYPDFKSLMREYEEGILLFEATKMLVWDKASQDTTGLKAFYEQSDKKYKWNERAQVSIYNVPDQYAEEVEKIRDFAQNHSPAEVLEKFNGEKRVITVTEQRFEKGRDKAADRIDWQVGAISRNRKDASLGITEFMKIEKILPAQNKTLAEARGYIIADYQDHLEKEWVETLEKEYKVKVYKKIFEKMIRK